MNQEMDQKVDQQMDQEMDQEMQNSLAGGADRSHRAAIKKGVFAHLKRSGTLGERVEEYIRSCDAPRGESESRSKRASLGRLPNLAGLCRYLGTGLGDLKAFSVKYPREYDNLLAIFEDEVLNYDTSSTMLTAYLKKRLCYADEPADEPEKITEVRYCFEHDITRDGE